MFKKEQIKDRMLKTAARLWDIPEGEIESNFDPLIMLIMEACAGELETLGGAIHTTQSRLIDQLAQFILPQAMINAQPASAIMQALPVEPVIHVNELIRFSTTQKLQKAGMSAYTRDFFFTPIGDFKIFKAAIRYLKSGQKWYKLSSPGLKEILFDEGGHGFSNEICLALTIDKSINSLEGLQLFFDLKGHSEASAFYSALPYARIQVNGLAADSSGGYYQNDQFALNLQDVLSAGHDYSRKIHRQTAGIYQNHFLHLSGNLSVSSSPALPEECRNLPEKIRTEMENEQLVFLRIEIGRYFQQEVLDRLSCHINAFPVVNRALNSMNYRTDSRVNIVPMSVEGSFLDLNSITGTIGRQYKIHTGTNDQQLEEGEAVVRGSGVGKTSSRDVRSIIGSLTEAIRDESAYFSRMNNEFILARLRDITRILARLEDQMAIASDKKEPLHYLLLRPRTAGETVTIDYWTTTGPEAHYLKSGSQLNAHNHTLTAPKSTFLLTNPAGGRSLTTENEKKYMLQRQLSSGNKIISAEDVRLLAFQLLGDRIKSITVKKSAHPGAGRSLGFCNSIDVHLELQGYPQDTMSEERAYLCRELEYLLNENSSPVYPFRVIVAS